jgi:hypothetical protein
MKKIIALFICSGLFAIAGCRKSDNNDQLPDPPKEVSIEEAASGEYEMSRFTADLEIEANFSGIPVIAELYVDGKNFEGTVVFDADNKKVEFDITMDLDVTYGISGQGDSFEDDGIVTAKMSFEIISQNRIRFYVKEGTDDEPFVFFNGFVIDDIELTVTERLTNSFKMRGNIDAEINYGGVFPGLPNTPFPTEGPIYIDLKR